jgi:hypothetical protein
MTHFGLSEKQLAMMDTRFKKNYNPPARGFSIDNLIDTLTEPLRDEVASCHSQLAKELMLAQYMNNINASMETILTYPDEMTKLFTREYSRPQKLLFAAKKQLTTTAQRPLVDAIFRLHTSLQQYRETQRACEPEFEYA